MFIKVTVTMSISIDSIRCRSLVCGACRNLPPTLV
jgi:hypothetical protein